VHTELNLLNLNLGVQVQVRQLAAPNLSVQVQVHKKWPEPEPNRTATSLCSDTFQSHAVEDEMNVDERAVAADGMSLKRSHIKTSLFMFLLLFKKKKQTVTVDLHILDVQTII
jgi:hypothetical protein